MTRNGYREVEIVTKGYPAGQAIWVVEHNGQRRADTGNPTGGKWHGPYKTQKEAEAALLGMWKPVEKQPGK
jgi:hypothetical protein